MHASDFQAAIDAWARAIDASPSNYIYRRRIQQYGPRLDKPYPFYDWIAEARDALRKRGAVVPNLVVEPEGSELATPLRKRDLAEADDREPDAKHAIAVDELAIAVDSVVAPNPVHPGSSFRLYWKLRANEGVKLDSESGPPIAWLVLPHGITTTRRKRSANPLTPSCTTAERTIEYELLVSPVRSTLHLSGRIDAPRCVALPRQITRSACVRAPYERRRYA
ncbi:MAG: hypothetical protein KDC95_12475, partial [Planctomycetes bacterium]|nr:hypothetical protein [Planctomycetota bacterium]